MASRRTVTIVENAGRPLAALDSSSSFLPSETQVYGALFFRKVFDRAQMLGYMNKSDCIHVSTLHQFIQRFADALGLHKMHFDPQELFKKSWISWKDMREHLEEDMVKKNAGNGDKMKIIFTVDMSSVERIDRIVQGDTDSYLGAVWSLLTFVLIMISIAAIMFVQLQGNGLQGFIVIAFTFDYLVKLVCSPFIRYTVANTDYLVRTVVPDPEDDRSLPEDTTQLGQLCRFLFAPMNIVDLASILPFWIDLTVGQSGIKLGFLRALRILRVVRLLKVGNFSETLLVLGDTLRRSADSFVVLVIMILFFSLLVGAVLAQMEEGNGKDDDGEPALWAFDRVVTSVYWVIGRLCNMHGSLLAGGQIPVEQVSSGLVLSLGIIKGCCLVLPVGQIAAAFKESDRDFKRTKDITNQVYRESLMPLGTEWVKDHQSPSVEVDLLSGDLLVGIGSFNAPLRKTAVVETTIIDVPIDSKLMQRSFRDVSPSIRVGVRWTPHADFKDGKGACPMGRLGLMLHSGSGFEGGAGEQWQVRFRVPVGLHGDGAMEEWKTGPSSDGVPQPRWDSAKDFEVKWVEQSDGVETKGSAGSSYGLETLERDLQARSKRIEALEKVLEKL